ncbi:hypothetical protein [Erythrobacter sp.]|jgi:hypothetical protein|uniref:hypothetical protein n=1 Tax=Erythrobacter sp. TaxID=1042 RepID=UPI002E9B0371|nr:hypothetical protein [Erythrobacter sp.]
MLGKIIGAAIGGGIAKKARGMDGTTGAMVGAAIPFILGRLSIPGMLALGAGGYLVKKMLADNEMPKPARDTAPVASVPQPVT